MSQARPGMVIAGRYRLDVLIGEGGMATVWRGSDLSLGRDVAIKVLREEIVSQPDAVARFRREAHAAAKLNHPNIIQIFDTGVDGDTHFIVMEYLPEPDLKKVIKGWAPLPEDRGVEVAVQCCRALAYAHRNGIVHRDVKPHNILFTDDGRVKLTDFGIAAAMGASSTDSEGSVLGSAHYISPEQMQGSPAGPHSDLYSLGCVLYECLTGRTPFEGDTEEEIAGRHLRDRPPGLRTLIPHVSSAVEFVVNRAMAREVAQRYRSADEMLGDLLRVAGGEELDRTGVLGAPDAATMRLKPDTARPPSGEPSSQPQGGNIRERFATQDAEPTPEAPRRASAPVVRPPAAPKPSVWGPIALAVLAVLVVLLVAWLVKTTFYPGEAPRQVQVPMVKGETPARAREILESNELILGDVRNTEDPIGPEGLVTEQDPAEGTMVQVNTMVNLVVNRGTEMVVTVSVVGRELNEAADVLQKAGLSLGEVTEIFHATVPNGIVIKQAPRHGAKVERGTEVDVTVSKGLEPETTIVPPETDDSETPPVASVEPDVRVVEDQSYSSSNPAERRFIVTIAVQGQELGQHIQVIKQDDSPARVVVLSEKLDPTETYEVPVITEGAAIIEVFHNGKVVFRQEEEAPAVVSPTPEAPADGGGP